MQFEDIQQGLHFLVEYKPHIAHTGPGRAKLNQWTYVVVVNGVETVTASMLCPSPNVCHFLTVKGLRNSPPRDGK